MVCNRVLLVEDEADARESLKLLLELEGFEVITAENGLEALRQLETIGAPCLILLDLMMPVMSGWEFLEVLEHQRSQVLAATPVIVISAAADVDAAHLARAYRFMKKPFDLDLLITLVRQHCACLDN